jgi:hypothetical protein
MPGFKCIIGCYIIIFICTKNSIAADVNYSVGLTLTHYENIRLVQNPVASEFSEEIRGFFLISEDTANLVANINGVLRSIYYKNNQIEDRNIGQLIGNALWIIRPSRFEWFLSNKFAQTSIDSFAGNAPSNQQNTNAFVTGPNYIMRLNSKNNIKIEGRIASNTFEKNTDNNRIAGAIRWLYDVNSSLNIGLNYRLESVDFQDQINNSNFRRSNLFLSTDYRRGLNTLQAKIGVTDINRELANNVTNTFYILSIKNQRTRTSSIRFIYENFLSDISNELVASGNNFTDNENQLAVTSNDIFVKDTVRFVYNKKMSAGIFELSTYRTDYEYTIQTNLDREIKAIKLVNTWNIFGTSRLDLQANYINTTFNSPFLNREDNDYIYSVIYTYNARRNINLKLRAISRERESTSIDRGYDDLRVFITLEFVSQ